ncbi:MAG TPA: response regulator [Bacteroidetes bacterium]|nr:response regulator [Bacteroidota bacterium]
MYFGGINGFNAFWPEKIKENQYDPPTVFTDFQVGNKSEPIGGKQSVLTKHINETNFLMLSHKQSDISFKVAALDYNIPEKNQFKYWLVNYDTGWIKIGNRRFISFTNLSPGKYELKVKGTNHDGVWNEKDGVWSDKVASVKIKIRPPFYWNLWAWIIYGISILSGFYWFYNFRLTLKLKHAESIRIKDLELAENARIKDLEHAENIRLKELDETKSRIFTNISHEFRSPLTIIMGMIENLKGDEKSKKSIQQESENLLTLINQILDLSKLESNHLKLKLIQDDIYGFIKYAIGSFQTLATLKSIHLNFFPEKKELIMDYDPERFREILYNLLSNAIKFTAEYGAVTVSAKEVVKNGKQFLEVKTKDTGIGIKKDKLKKIFERFHQEDDSDTRRAEGIGIGLALTKGLVELMGGSITVESEIGKGSVFIFWLPITRNAEIKKGQNARTVFKANYTPENILDETQIPCIESPSVLLIEDNLGVLNYLKQCLKNYNVLTATNGDKGIKTALDKVPDIIISDVMMPEKDGLEVCDTLKNNEITSHIPIILLTAKADVDSRIAGLKRGADDYLAKPFHKEDLIVRMGNLIRLRKQLQQRYSKGPIVEPNEEYEIEDGFFQKVYKIVEDHFDDPEFGVKQLCSKANKSNMQINRKLSALTGKTPTLFIRSIRLKKSKELLQSTDLNISEIAYQVGFSNPNYFSRAFNKEFGYPPSSERK